VLTDGCEVENSKLLDDDGNPRSDFSQFGIQESCLLIHGQTAGSTSISFGREIKV
jgi:hypothetical protein